MLWDWPKETHAGNAENYLFRNGIYYFNSASLNGSRSKASRRSGSKAVPFLLNPRFRQPKPAKV